MTCEDALERLEPFLDRPDDGEGETLADPEAEALRDHLEGCPGCARELQLAALVREELRELPQLRCPPGVVEDVLDEVHRRVQPERPPRLTGPWVPRSPSARSVLAAAAVLALAAVGVLLLGRFGTPSEAPPSAGSEIARADRHARLAFAYVERATRRAAGELRREVLAERLVEPMIRHALRPATVEHPAAASEADGGPKPELR